jgi:hypothetical protein
MGTDRQNSFHKYRLDTVLRLLISLSHIQVKILDILKNLNQAVPTTKRPEDSAIPHLSSIQETAQMQGSSDRKLGGTQSSLVN